MAGSRVTVLANDHIDGIGDRVDEGGVDDSCATGSRELAADALSGTSRSGIGVQEAASVSYKDIRGRAVVYRASEPFRAYGDWPRAGSSGRRPAEHAREFVE